MALFKCWPTNYRCLQDTSNHIRVTISMTVFPRDLVAPLSFFFLPLSRQGKQAPWSTIERNVRIYRRRCFSSSSGFVSGKNQIKAAINFHRDQIAGDVQIASCSFVFVERAIVFICCCCFFLPSSSKWFCPCFKALHPLHSGALKPSIQKPRRGDWNSNIYKV